MNTRPFNLRYIVRAPSGIRGDEARATHHTAACNYWYIVRSQGIDDIGPSPDFSLRTDLLDCGRGGPIASKDTSLEGVALWHTADRMARDRMPDRATAMHAVGSLPEDGNLKSWRAIIDAFLHDEIAARGMICDWAIHAMPDGNDGYTIRPHSHFLITSRGWRVERDLGLPMRRWLSSKAQVNHLADQWYGLTGLYPTEHRGSAAL